MKRNPIGTRATLLLALIIVLPGAVLVLNSLCESSPIRVDPSRYAGSRAMAERLREIADGFNGAQLGELLKRFWPTTGLGKYLAEIKTPPDERSRILIEARKAVELLVAGRTAESVQGYERARRMAEANRQMFDAGFLRALREALALAYLRLGEQQNCVERHNPDSCLLPIGGRGVHTIEEGSRAAAREYAALLEEDPDDLVCRWLLNIAHMTLGEYPDKVPRRWLIPPEVFRSQYDIGRFPDVAGLLGLDAEGHSGGSIMEDFDRDGYLDIMASSSWPSDQIRYFHNNGDGSFSDRTREAGLIGITGGLNIVHADYDNDGYPDVLVLRGAWLGELGRHPNSLLRNNRDGTFEDVTVRAGLLSFHPTQVAAWGDYDNDGWIDLFIGNESVTLPGIWNMIRIRPEELPEVLPRPKRHRCELFHNNGDGTFTNLAEKAGLDLVGFVKGAAWGDYDN